MFNIHIEKNSSTKGTYYVIHFYYEHKDERSFLGYAILNEIESSNLLELTAICAQNGFGKSFFSILTMLSFQDNKFIVADRESNSRSQVLFNFELLLKNKNVNTIKLDDTFNQNLFDLECEVELLGFNQKPNLYFSNIKQKLAILPNNSIPEEWDVFGEIYSNSENYNVFKDFFPISFNKKTELLNKLNSLFC